MLNQQTCSIHRIRDGEFSGAACSRLTSAQLDDACDDDENERKQLGIGKYILDSHAPLDIH